MVRPTSSCTEKLFQVGKENEDSKGFPYLSKYDGGISRNMAKKPAGMKRSCGKNCRIRWNNQIETNFSPEEEDLIIKLHSTIGSRWTIIAQQLPGRTDNEVKNFWNKKLKKKLTAVGIDPITHRPFSQILADYGNINNGGGFSSHKSRNHFFGGLKKTEHQYYHSVLKKSDISSDFNAHFDSRISCLQESSKDHYFARISDPNNNNNSNDDDNDNGNGNSLDLLSQLQAIAMVTDYNSSRKNSCFQETFPFPMSDQSATNNSIASSSSFSWCDFLLEDEFLPVNEGEEQENGTGINEVCRKKKKEQQQHPPTTAALAEEEEEGESHTLSNRRTTAHQDYTAVSGGSFVEAILETETDEMLSDFHGFLDEPF